MIRLKENWCFDYSARIHVFIFICFDILFFPFYFPFTSMSSISMAFNNPTNINTTYTTWYMNGN